MPTKTETQDKINRFKNVAAGWHFGEGVPADGYTINAAIKLNEWLYDAGFLSTDAFLGVGGQIQVNGYWDDLYFEFIIEDKLISYVLEKNGRIEIEEEDLGLLDTLSRIQFWGKKWAMSEFSTKMISIVHWEDLLAHPFLIQVQAASLLLIQSASGLQEERSANTSQYTIQESQVTPQFTSNSPKIYYQLSASS
jgi:hypothetical protein